jgi:hypothetical protein
MHWKKLGFIYSADGESDWGRHSALQPTPFLLNDKTIRVYCGFRDDDGVGRIGFVDVDSKNPCRVLKVSDYPVLDIGAPGTFDDNGVIPCAVVRRDSKLYLYYAGYQLARKVKFLAFGGLALSEDNGNSFVRHKVVPVFERTSEEPLFRAIHCIFYEKGVWKAWYSAGDKFITINGTPHPTYNTRYIESADGVNFQGSGDICIPLQYHDEYRVGRPSVVRTGNLYRMFYSWGATNGGLKLGYAESIDGRQWQRADEKLNLKPSESGWDSLDMSYPSILITDGTIYLFYNGNDFGRAGFGAALLVEW